MVQIENLVKIFAVDTLICATQALQLMKYQLEKHGWTKEQWKEFYYIYIKNLDKIKVKN